MEGGGQKHVRGGGGLRRRTGGGICGHCPRWVYIPLLGVTLAFYLTPLWKVEKKDMSDWDEKVGYGL
jgi:hypothetical protein